MRLTLRRRDCPPDVLAALMALARDPEFENCEDLVSSIILAAHVGRHRGKLTMAHVENARRACQAQAMRS